MNRIIFFGLLFLYSFSAIAQTAPEVIMACINEKDGSNVSSNGSGPAYSHWNPTSVICNVKASWNAPWDKVKWTGRFGQNSKALKVIKEAQIEKSKTKDSQFEFSFQIDSDTLQKNLKIKSKKAKFTERQIEAFDALFDVTVLFQKGDSTLWRASVQTESEYAFGE